MSHEIEVLDQLLGGDLPLHVISSFFPELADCKRALAAMISSGEIIVTDPNGKSTELRRFLELGTKLEVWKLGSGYRVDITRLGAKRVS